MKKVVKFTIIFVFIILLILVIKRIIEYKVMPKNSVDDFATIKEIVEFDGHRYIDMVNSEEEGYEKDIYINFSKDTINDDGTTNKSLYETVISHIAKKLRGDNFRLIDNEKKIIIRIKFQDDKISLYTINEDSKYWEHLKTNYQIENYKEEKLSDFSISSRILNDIINNNWVYNNINLGSKDSVEDNYEIYSDEGYKVRKLGASIYNIIFIENYNEEILNGISTQTSMNDIENILGEPFLEDDNNNIIGYKSEKMYIFFSNNEVSIYPIEQYEEEKSKKFGELVTELNKTGDINTFINKLTDLYPNYANYTNNNNYIDIEYPLLGFTFRFGYSNRNGIIIYSNFNGWITEDKTIEDIKETNDIPANVYTELNENLVLKVEGNRVSNERYLESGL